MYDKTMDSSCSFVKAKQQDVSKHVSERVMHHSPVLSHDARPPPPEKQVAEAEKWVAGAQLIR